MLRLFLHMYYVAQPNRCLTETASTDINQGNRNTIGVYMRLIYQVTQPSFLFVCYPDRNYTVPIVSVHYNYTVHCIATAILYKNSIMCYQYIIANYAILYKNSMNVVT